MVRRQVCLVTLEVTTAVGVEMERFGPTVRSAARGQTVKRRGSLVRSVAGGSPPSGVWARVRALPEVVMEGRGRFLVTLEVTAV